MIEQSIDNFIDHCRITLDEKQIVTDKDIEEVIETFAVLFPNVDRLEVKKRLMLLNSIPVSPYTTLFDSDNPGAGWLQENDHERKKKIKWSFWNRYKKYLRDKEKYQPNVIKQLDRLTDDILDNLYDPELINSNFSKKGLVVGQVQSGKTSNFTGLICKSVDAGFNVIIVFAGILDDLRTQTQNRLENCFLGFTTKDIKQIRDNEKDFIGVGTIDQRPIAHAFTTVLSDFKESNVNSLGTNFQTKEPILFVVKKNGRILANLIKWLSKKDLDGKSVLFIDDEADNASVNTSKDKSKASSINGKIRDILSLFRRNAYVGYTATPYANIFIDKEDENDLFPRHFIFNLPTPPAYLSPERVFGLDSDTSQPLPIVNVIKDYKNFVPDKHKIDDRYTLVYENIPDSLKYAVRCFILACAVRCVRGQVKKHNSMLIHLSRFQVWQNEIKSLIERLFNYYKSNILSDDFQILQLLKEDYEDSFISKTEKFQMEYKSFVQTTAEVIESEYEIIKDGITPVSWEDVKEYLCHVVSKIEVKALNGSSADTLAYEDNKEDGYYVIAIGGDKLSRGLTLEGLTISYFLRASKMYDTLMQMGRWFGYRPKYVDVCRLFISEEINYWFKDITIANNELREDFDYLWESKGSPRQYALKVRISPGLLVTSPLKMFSTKDIQISWASTLVETYSLIRSIDSVNRNYRLTFDFLQSLGDRYKKDGKDDDDQGYLWTNVTPEKVCDFIEHFEIADTSSRKMNLKNMSEYIKFCVKEYGELTSWRVLLRKNREPESMEKFEYDFSGGLTGFCTNRTRVINPEQDDNIYNLKNYHLISGPSDEFLDFKIIGESLKEALEETKKIKKDQHVENPSAKDKEWTNDYPSPVLVRRKYRSVDNPLLIVYPLNPKKADFEECDKPFIGFAIVFPKSKNSRGVNYKVNEAQDLIDSEINFEKTNDNQYPDEE